MRIRTLARPALAAVFAVSIAAGCQATRDIGAVAEDTGESIASTETWQSISSNWNQFTDAAGDRWDALTDDDMDDIDGDRQTLVQKVSEAYDVSMEAASDQVDEWAAALRS